LNVNNGVAKGVARSSIYRIINRNATAAGAD